MDKYKILLGERIKNIRKNKGITQSELAELVNRSKNHISKIETGSANPPLSLLIEIADALEIELASLLNIKKSQTKILDKIDWNSEIDKIKDKKEKQFILKMLNNMLEEII
ncbi:MAG: helix-turn-helix domain-containing protein [Candidatus Gastranaerophilales bacterium]|nr:helix-turn-helix domain-containing protein [Candidatus Gastranaerophilales bacterium]